ncbi:MAG: type I DNA topoisomerase [Chloroflexota bacterium]
MKIVIIESKAKKKKLTKLLANIYGSGQFRVVASLGHIRDLPHSELGIDVANGFRPRYVITKHKKRTVKALHKYVADADAVYLAADPDREGEAIAWHIMQVTRPKVPIYRVTFNEITQAAVQRAFNTPRQIDMAMVAAQEARRILDRLVGYKVSPALWRGLDASGLSAGRVQSIALKLVVERQSEIDHFVTQHYWSIIGTFGVPEGQFEAKLIMWGGHPWIPQTFTTEDAAQDVTSQLEDALFKIQKVVVKDHYRKPPAPFTTSTLQQAASSHLKLSPDKTMSIAQSLYEAGYITYMRTDSPAVSDEATQQAIAIIQDLYGDMYVPDKRPTYKSKGDAQAAHECIRPTDITRSHISEELDDHSMQLYRLIWQRFIASQMIDARYEQTSVYVAGGKALFIARQSQLQVDGFLRVYTYGADVAESDDNATDAEDGKQILPPLMADQTCRALNLTPQRHTTRPPHMYSEAALVKALEQRGVGRPSTYSLMVTTIRQRKYVKVQKRRLIPTTLGQRVTQFLDTHFALIMSYDFTKTMEDALDKIATGDLDTHQFLGVFWKNFEPLTRPWAHVTPQQTEPQLTGEICPVCGRGQIEIKSSRKGRFLGCNRYPQCKYSRDIKKAAPVLVGRQCPECSAQLCVRSRRDSDEKFIGCTNYPQCRHTESFSPKPTA